MVRRSGPNNWMSPRRIFLRCRILFSAKLVRSLSLQLTGTEQKYLAKRWTENAEAYRLYVTGRYLWNQRDESDRRKAIEYFNEAIAVDPNYALAYTGLADCYLLGGRNTNASSAELMAKARDAAAKALNIDPTLAEAHASLTLISLVYDWDFQAAAEGFRHAIELNPNYAVAHHWYSEYLVVTERTDEAILEIKQAKELDPSSLIIERDLGRTHYFSDRPDEAIEIYLDILGRNPDFFPAVYYLGLAYWQKGMLNEAVNTVETADRLARGSSLTKSLLVHVYAKSGQRERSEEVFAQLLERSQKTRVPAFDLAAAYSGLGRYDEAFAELQRSCEERSYRLIYFKVDPLFDGLRSDPRYDSILRCVGVSP